MSTLFQGDYALTDQQISDYQENGFVRCENMFTPEEVEYLKSALAIAQEKRKGFVRDLGKKPEEQKNDAGGDQILQMLNLWEHYDEFKPMTLSKRLGNVAKKLTGSEEIRVFHDQALIKDPHANTPSPWHQDQPYWPSKESGMLSIWIALDDVPVERGCMQFVPGSQKWGEFPPVSFTGDPDALYNMLSDEQKAQYEVVAEPIKAGDCTWHHGLTFHYTNGNSTDVPRRVLTIIFIPDGVTYAGDDKMEHALTPTITSKKGELLRGTSFPQVA
jgi:ectoine hydroxylase-related dioxygenase (phytanoyl-CoA dioxygenase family)